ATTRPATRCSTRGSRPTRWARPGALPGSAGVPAPDGPADVVLGREAVPGLPARGLPRRRQGGALARPAAAGRLRPARLCGPERLRDRHPGGLREGGRVGRPVRAAAPDPVRDPRRPWVNGWWPG